MTQRTIHVDTHIMTEPTIHVDTHIMTEPTIHVDTPQKVHRGEGPTT
jgi:hypothetical protein